MPHIIIEDIHKLLDIFVNFLENKIPIQELTISCSLRKPLREFKEKFPSIYYFAYGNGNEYRLLISNKKIDINFSELTDKCKKVFMLATGIQINFEQIQAYEKLSKYCDLPKWLELFQSALLHFGCERDFISMHYELIDLVAEDIKKSDSYTESKNKIVEPAKLNLKQKRKMNGFLYTDHYDMGYYLSIDLKSANFQALRLIGLIKEATWDEYIKKWNLPEYFCQAKSWRVRVLSSPDLFPKKITLFWTNIIVEIVNKIIESELYAENQVAILNSDEIVFVIKKESMFHDVITIRDFLSKYFPQYLTQVNIFQLRKLAKDKQYYVKINQETNNKEFKCVTFDNMLNAIKLLENLV